MKSTKDLKVIVPATYAMVDLVGHQDHLLRLIEERFTSKITVRGNEIMISGEAAEAEEVAAIFAELLSLLAMGRTIGEHEIGMALRLKEEEKSPSEVLGDQIVSYRGKTIGPKTAGQKRYVDEIRKSIVTFAIGPAGTGKTYLAMAMAVRALKAKEVGRIILTRPAVEAGEKLGFLPGGVYEKVDPYLRPLFDALYTMMDAEELQRLTERGVIEIAPLAYMRGRTLNDSFIILDEAQNTSPEQMKMFLTRLGFGSKIIITGDRTQTDLPKGQFSGLIMVEDILQSIEGIAFVNLTAKDVVRHRLVQDIVEAYKTYEDKKDDQTGRSIDGQR